MIENFTNSTNYARKFFKDDKNLLEIKDYAISNKVPIITDEVLSFMLFLANNKDYKKGLEIGTAIGYSTLYLSKFLEMTTIEIDENRYLVAKENFEKYNKNINLINDDALNVIENLNDNFDFIFIDAAKGQYKRFFDLCYGKLNKGGLIFIDNILFRSYVGSNEYPKKFKTIVNRLDEFITYLSDNYNFTLIPFGDGVGLVKREEK
ncbi:O-methyltransferase [Oceanivirga miroungae]|uniref:tRNA 5-hydroxyuridine methyltransferase n=1 Tax=Oceanivirga miroungae TaxID=1130046 RepID=A0A6I8M957_9FUSO|nr:O-methyltransferase [Oceanivirga miroungae]VWL84813.1 O-methyltransferase family protein [Oceanivirga miroungae]